MTSTVKKVYSVKVSHLGQIHEPSGGSVKKSLNTTVLRALKCSVSTSCYSRCFLSSMSEGCTAERDLHPPPPSILFFPAQKLYHGTMHFTELDSDSVPMYVARPPYYLPRIDEELEIHDNVAIINVPKPRFGESDPAYILHDFQRVRSLLAPRICVECPEGCGFKFPAPGALHTGQPCAVTPCPAHW